MIRAFVLYTTAKITDSGLDDDIVENRVSQSDFRRAVWRLYDTKVFDVKISKRCNKCVSFALVMPMCITQIKLDRKTIKCHRAVNIYQ